MLNWILSSSVLILLTVLTRFLLKGKISQRLQYALWVLVLLRLLIPVSIGSSRISTANLVQPSAAQITLPAVGTPTAIPQPYFPAQNPAPNREEISMEPEHRISPATVGKILWLSGSILCGAVILASNLRFGRMLKRDRRMLEAHAVPVYCSKRVDSPCLFGLFSPAIYLTPESAENETLKIHAIAHEMTHFRHKDHIWSALRCIALCLHWYNPLVWWAASLSKADGELACDESTIAVLGEHQRAAYGETLIRLTCKKAAYPLLTATTMVGDSRFLRERIARIVKKPKMAVCTVLCVMLISLLAVGCTFTGAKNAETAPPAETAAPTETTIPAETTAPVETTAKDAETVAAEIEQLEEELETILGQMEKVDTVCQDGHPTEILRAFFARWNTVVMEYYDNGPQSTRPGFVCNSYVNRLEAILLEYDWSRSIDLSEEVDLNDVPCITLVGESRTEGIILLDYGSGVFIFENAEGTECWSVTSGPKGESLFKTVKRDYDSMSVSASLVSFPDNRDAAAAAEYFVNTAYGDHLLAQPHGSQYEIREYVPVSWDILAISEDGNAVLGSFTFGFIPVNWESPDLWAGNTREGTGDYAGMLTASREFVLRLQEDGLWHCTAFATGGCSLP